ncbi:MAG: hypothetical protein Q9204_001517 [Flavoplaca sp. TL-2023a]
MVDVAHKPPRPPTPPKENGQDTLRLPADQSNQGTISQHALLDTPNESPASSSDYFAGSARRMHKRVVFSPWTQFHKDAHAADNQAVLDAKLRPLPPSRECFALRKPILKASPSVHFLQPLVLDPDQGFAIMLQSVTGRLTHASRDLRLDTYKALLGCLAAHDNVPKKETLGAYLGGFLNLIRQDIVARQPATDTFDTELVTSALKILSAMVCTQGLVDAMPEDFCTFVAETAVSSLEHQEIPKIMVDHYMQLLGRQKFSENTINATRVNRLLNSLNGLEDRVKGNRVIGLKIMIYQRLLLQARSLMIGRVGQWLEFLIVCVSSSIRDIRTRAIAFGTDAALALGGTGTVSQTCLDLLNREHPSGARVVDSLGSRMHELLDDRDGAIHVPQIWSIVVLFLRSRHHQIERWEHFTNWFGIMQHSFNSSDAKVKRQANVAWNRLVSAISLDTSTGLSMIEMLRRPIAAQLERKSSDKHLKTAKQVARSSYCNLLYFAFRPQAPQEQLDLYWKRLDLFWDNFVVPVLAPKTPLTKSDHEFACQVLASVLSSPECRSWEHDRAHQVHLLIKPEELPCLDPKWVRLRAAKIMSLLERLLQHTNCPSLDDFRKSHFFIAWQSFAKALGEAASKDVHKVYVETMAAFAQITSMLNRHWHQREGTSEVFLRRLQVCSALIHEMLAQVGFRPFVEKRLFCDSAGVTFEAAESPSSRSSHSPRYLNTPIMYILGFFVNNSHGTETSALYEEAIYSFLAIALHAASCKRRKLAALRQLAADILSRRYVSVPPRIVFWNCLAKETAAALSLSKTKTSVSDSPQYPGQEYRQCILLLELGFREFGHELYPSWKSLSDVVIKDIEKEVGEAGIVLAYTEPLAGAMWEGVESSPDASLCYVANIVDQARWPVSRKELERARKQLWGPEQSVPKEASLDPFDNLYSVVVTLLTSAYSTPRPVSHHAVFEFLSSVTSFLHLCPRSMKAVCLKRLQKGLAVWIEDSNDILSHTDDDRAHGTLSTAIKRLWKTVLDAIESIAKPDSNLLSMLEDLFRAGFQSRHMTIVNNLISMWNHTFARADSLNYPADLRAVLTKLRSRVDLEVPGLVDHAEPEVPSSPIHYVDSQDEDTEAKHKPAAAEAGRFLKARALHETTHFRKTASHSPNASSARVLRRKPESTPKARLRHDDSQVEFAAIDSSPLNPEADETQHLTDHQKEIRERQENDAPMFSDIRSIRKTPQSAERPLEFILHTRTTSDKPLDVDAEPSPTFPPGDATMNEFLGSSPTPCSNSKNSVDHTLEERPGVSPPNSPMPMSQQVPAYVKTTQEGTDLPKDAPLKVDLMAQSAKASAAAGLASCTTLNTLGDGYFNSPPAQNIIVNQEQSRGPKQTTPQTAGFTDQDGHDHVKAPTVPNVAAVVSAPIHKDMKDHDEINVGSVSTRTLPKLTTPRSTDETRPRTARTKHTNTGRAGSMEESPCAAEPSTPTEDELVREQLLRDLEEASSQADSHIPKRRPSLSSPSEASKKRKNLSKDHTKPRKRARPELPSSSQTVQVVVETRRNDLNDDEYIVVDDRPSDGTEWLSSPVVKQERSPSPAKIVQPCSSQESALKKPFTRRRTRSMAEGNSPQSSDVVEDCPYGELSSNRADSGPLKQASRKRRRSAQSQNDGPEESIKRHIQANGPQHTSVAAGWQERPVEEKDLSSSQMEGIKKTVLGVGDALPEASNAFASQSIGRDTIPETPLDDTQQAEEPSRTFQAGRSSGQRLLDRFKGLLNDLRNVTLWPAEEKEMMKVALEVVGGVHEAGFRNGRREE